ncbi:MAG: glycosyltransferase [Candidatus Verstraetearchaeota archaeon]|nr:glycosyltransferase [Candidatus Verstraetearchaeota archaeon]
MKTLIYANHGTSPYDVLFLKHLSHDYKTILLTFDPKAEEYVKELVPEAKVITMPDVPFKFSNKEGFYSKVFTRALGFVTRIFIFDLYLRHIKHDLLIGNWALTYGFYSALWSKQNYVLFVWGSDVLLGPKFLLYKALVMFSVKRAKLVLLDSLVQARAALRLGCDPKKLIIFPWFDPKEVVAISAKRKNQRERDDLRTKMGWGASDPIIICTRRFEPIYDVETLVEAAKDVVMKIHNARFILIGGGMQDSKLRERIETRGLASNFSVLNWISRDEIIKMVALSDVYVSTSLTDGSSASLMEAMVVGTPPVVSDIPGNREWILNGENGILFPVKDKKELAATLIALLSDSKLRQTLSRNARSTVFERADWDRNFIKLREALDRLA